MLLKAGRINWDDINLNKIYQPNDGYKQSKLCNILFTNYLLKNLKKNSMSHVSVFSVSPGVVLTELGRHILNRNFITKALSFIFYPLLWISMRSPKQGKIDYSYSRSE